MSADPLPTILWRRKWTVLATIALFAVVTALVTPTLPKVYATSVQFIITQPRDAQSFDAVQAAQVAARTYARIVDSPNVARDVSARLGSDLSPGELQGKVKVEPVPETQLLKLTVEDEDPREAQRIAQAYADVFVAHVRRLLTPVTQQSVTVADRPVIPEDPVKPSPKLYLALALLLGAATGIGLAVLRERLDRRVRGLEELEEEFGLPTLARVPRRGKSELSQAAFTDAFRLLRTNLRFAGPEGELNTIAVTSAAAGEGKSTTVSQLAIVGAGAGGRVVVVEADLRRTSQQAVFFPSARGPLLPGLTTYIVGGASLPDVLHATPVPSVELIPAGPLVPSLAGLLDSGRGRSFLEEAAEYADLVLVDCPPLSAGADASTIAGRVDGVILVVDTAVTTREGIRNALRQLTAVRATVLGIVVNRDASVLPTQYGYGEESPRERSGSGRL